MVILESNALNGTVSGTNVAAMVHVMHQTNVGAIQGSPRKTVQYIIAVLMSSIHHKYVPRMEHVLLQIPALVNQVTTVLTANFIIVHRYPITTR